MQKIEDSKKRKTFGVSMSDAEKAKLQMVADIMARGNISEAIRFMVDKTMRGVREVSE